MKVFILLFFLVYSSQVLLSQNNLNLSAIENDDGLFGFSDSSGKIVIPCKYQQVNNFTEGFASVKKNGKWGFINSKGKEITDFLFDTNEDGWDYASYFFKDGISLVQKNGKYGYINTSGKEIVPVKYDWLGEFEENQAEARLEGFNFYIDKKGEIIGLINNYIEVYNNEDDYTRWGVSFKNGKFGFTDENEKEICQPKYDFFKGFDGKELWVQLGNKWSKINNTGKELLPFKYEDVKLQNDGYSIVLYQNKWGIIKENFNEVFPCKFDKITTYKNQYFATLRNSLYILDKKGETVSLEKYDWSSDPFAELWPQQYDYGEMKAKENCIFVNKNGKKGMFDLTSYKETIPCMYNKIFFFNNNVARVSKDNLCGLINSSGKELTPLKYSEIFSSFYPSFDSDTIDILTYTINKKQGLLDVSGKELCSAKYDMIHDFSSIHPKWALVKNNEKWGFINKTGVEVIPVKYNSLTIFVDGKSLFKLNEEAGYIDSLGNETFEKDLPKVLVPFCERDLWGYCDTNMNVVYKAKYEETFPFDGNIAKIKIQGKYGLINKLGINILPAWEDEISEFIDGKALVKRDHSYSKIDKTGERYYDYNEDDDIILESKYGYIYSFYDGLAKVKVNGKIGYINETDNMVIPAIYEDGQEFHEGKAAVKKNGKYGFINSKGEKIIEFKYDDANSFTNNLAKIKFGYREAYIDSRGKEYFFNVKTDTVEVNNINELLDNIASDRCLLLNPGKYVITEYEGLQEKLSRYYYDYKDINLSYNVVVCEQGLKLKKLHDLKLIGKSKKPEETSFICTDESNEVLILEDCNNISIENLNIGHEPTTMGTNCSSGVIYFINCHKINFSNSILFGSGTIGFRGKIEGLYCNKVTIKECSEGIMDLEGNNFLFENCSFFKNISYSDFIRISKAVNCKFDKCKIYNNSTTNDKEIGYLLLSENNANITLNNCEITGNTAKGLSGQKNNIELNKGIISKNNFIEK